MVWFATRRGANDKSCLHRNDRGTARRLRVAALCMVGSISSAQAGTLTDLGYPDGLTLRGPDASQTVYFPLPAGSQGAILNLHFAASAAHDPNASVTVLANGVPLATVPDKTAGGIAQITVPPRFTQSEFLQITLAADQTVGGVISCYDNDSPANWTLIDPATTLTANTTQPIGPGDLWGQLSTPLAIALPAQPALSDIETALILSVALVERGVAPYFTTDPSTAGIIIDPTQPGLAAQAPATPGGLTQLEVPNAGAARALVAAGQALNNPAQAAAQGALVPGAKPPAGHITLGALGMGPSTIAVGHSAVLDLPLPLAGLPGGSHIAALRLYGHGAAMPPGQSEILALEIGGSVIWSRAYSSEIVLTNERVMLPQPVLASGAKLTLHLVRVGESSNCQRAAPLDFTLQDNTSIELADGNASPTRFAGFTAAGDGTMPVLTSLAPATLPPALPLLAELLGAAGADPLAVTMATADAVPTRPFILVAHQPGTLLSVAPLPSLTGPLVVPLPNQQGQVSLPNDGTASLLQLVTAGPASTPVAGLWLSPGNAASLAQAVLPGDGNLAVYTGRGAPAVFLTELHDAVFQTGTTTWEEKILSYWNVELLALFWIAATMLVVSLVVRRRRRGK